MSESSGPLCRLRVVWVVVGVTGLMVAPACDDTLIGVPRDDVALDDCNESVATPRYTSDWQGVEDMFADHCAACHPAINPFVLDSLARDLQSGTGQFVVPEDPPGSMFWRLIDASTTEGDPRVMPDNGTGLGLPCEERLHVERWIEAGAPLTDGEIE